MPFASTCHGHCQIFEFLSFFYVYSFFLPSNRFHFRDGPDVLCRVRRLNSSGYLLSFVRIGIVSFSFVLLPLLGYVCVVFVGYLIAIRLDLRRIR